jgi:hypothetical protein
VRIILRKGRARRMMMDIFLNCQYGGAIEDSGIDLLLSWQSRFQDHGDRKDDDG